MDWLMICVNLLFFVIYGYLNYRFSKQKGMDLVDEIIRYQQKTVPKNFDQKAS